MRNLLTVFAVTNNILPTPPHWPARKEWRPITGKCEASAQTLAICQFHKHYHIFIQSVHSEKAPERFWWFKIYDSFLMVWCSIFYFTIFGRELYLLAVFHILFDTIFMLTFAVDFYLVFVDNRRNLSLRSFLADILTIHFSVHCLMLLNPILISEINKINCYNCCLCHQWLLYCYHSTRIIIKFSLHAILQFAKIV